MQSFDVLIDTVDEETMNIQYKPVIKEMGYIELELVYPCNNIVQRLLIKD